MGTEEAADTDPDQNKSIDKMLLVEDGSDEGCGAHDDDEMLVWAKFRKYCILNHVTQVAD